VPDPDRIKKMRAVEENRKKCKLHHLCEFSEMRMCGKVFRSFAKDYFLCEFFLPTSLKAVFLVLAGNCFSMLVYGGNASMLEKFHFIVPHLFHTNAQK